MTDIDEDLVKLANSLFNSEEVVGKIFYMVLEFWLKDQVLNPVVNYSPVVNPQNPSFDPFEEYTPPASGAEYFQSQDPWLVILSFFHSGPSLYPGSIQDILDSLDGQYPPSDQGLPKPYDPPPELHYPPATHPPTQKPTKPPAQLGV